MDLVFDYTSLEAYLNNKPDRLVVEQLLLSGTVKYTYDMVLSDLYEKRNHAVGADQANAEIEDLRRLFVIWTYPVFDAEIVRIQEEHRLPYTEAACVAIAEHLSCPVITASHYSFDSIVENEVCGVCLRVEASRRRQAVNC